MVTAECHAHIFMDGVDYKKAAAAHENGPREDMIRAQRRFVSPLAAGRICDLLEMPRGAEGRALNLCPALGKG